MNKKARAAALAAQFKSQAAKIEETATAEVRLPIPSVASDFVFEFIGRRIDLNSLLIAGQLPEAYARKLLGAKLDDMPADKEAQLQRAIEEANQMTADERKANLDFQRDVALKVCVAPRLVFREAQGDDEIDLREIPWSGDLIAALFQWAMSLSPEVPVAQTDGEETTVAAVETFPVGASSEKLSDPVPAWAKFQQEGERIAQARR